MPYEKTFLADVIVRADYSSPIESLRKSIPTELDDAAKSSFPLFEPRAYTRGGIQLGPKGVIPIESLKGTDWTYHGEARQKTLMVSDDHFDISYKQYESYETLRANFEHLLDALVECEEAIQFTRLGLRYVNYIEFPGHNDLFDWDQYLMDSLLCILGVPEEQSLIARAFHNLTLQYGDMLLRFQYGMYNPDFPAKIVRKGFTLDYDAYFEGILDTAALLPKLDAFHARIEELFESHIRQPLREVMGWTNE